MHFRCPVRKTLFKLLCCANSYTIDDEYSKMRAALKNVPMVVKSNYSNVTINCEGTTLKAAENEINADDELPVRPLFKLGFFLSSNQKCQYKDMIEQLGGRVSDDDQETQHDVLIVSETFADVMLLSSLASGKWILHPDFLTKSLEAKKFVKPIDFEWGSNANLKPSSFDHSPQAANACCRWRNEKKNNGGLDAFHDLRVVIIAQSADKFLEIVTAGGGQGLAVNIQKTKNVKEYRLALIQLYQMLQEDEQKSYRTPLNYVFIDFPYKIKDEIFEMLQSFIDLEIVFLDVDYISEYLLSNPSPNPEKFKIVDFVHTLIPPTKSNDLRENSCFCF